MEEILPGELLDRVQRRLSASGGAHPGAAAVASAVRAEMGGLISDATMLRLIRAVQQELVGAGPLTELLADPAATDVVVNGPDDVRVDRGAGWERVPISFGDDAGVQRLARRLAAAADRRLDDGQPFVDAQIGSGVRMHAVLAPVAASGSCLSFRVLRPASFDLAALADRGTFGPGVVDVLRRLVAARLAFLVSGGTGSGKTTLLAALLGEVDDAERLLIVEDAAELRPTHPHVVRLVCRGSNVEGAGRVDLRDLVRQGLRMRPDRIVVGEVRGPEIADLLIALNTGHRGCAGTVHANNAADVPSRLVALAALGGMAESVLHAQLAAAVQVVIHVQRDVLSERVSRRVPRNRDTGIRRFRPSDDANRARPRGAARTGRRPARSAARRCRLAVSWVLLAAALVCWAAPPDLSSMSRRTTRARRDARRLRRLLSRPSAVITAIVATALLVAFTSGSIAAGCAVLPAGATAAVLIRDLLHSRRRHRRQLATRDLLRALSPRAGRRCVPCRRRWPARPRDAAEPIRQLADGLVAVARRGEHSAAGPSPPQDWTAGALLAAVNLSRRHGIAVAGLVARLADAVSEDVDAGQQQAAALAGARLSGWLLAALPLVGVALGAGIGANPIPVLFGAGPGGVLLVVGTTLCCAGLLWSARIAR